MFENNTHAPILLILFISVLVTSCNESAQTTNTDTAATIEQATIVKKVEKIAMQKTTAPRPKTALKLSISDIEDTPDTDEVNVTTNQNVTNELELQAQKLTSKHKDDGIKFSGKLLTDEVKVANREYLNSVDGAMLNIKGSFR